MKPDDLRDSALVEMAVNSVTDLHMQSRDVVGLGEDRLPQGPGGEAPSGASSMMKITSAKLLPADALIVSIE